MTGAVEVERELIIDVLVLLRELAERERYTTGVVSEDTTRTIRRLEQYA